MLLKEDIDSELIDLFRRYMDESFKFEKNVINNIFTFAILRTVRNVSDMTLVKAGTLREINYYHELKAIIFQKDIKRQEVEEFTKGLEAFDCHLSNRANYLLGILILIVSLSNLGNLFIEYVLPSQYALIVKIVLSLIWLSVTISCLADAWHFKKVSARLQSFIVLCKGVLE